METDDFELSWFRTCQTSEFIPEETAKEFRKELRRRRRKNAFAEGLRDFAELRCPHCGAKGYFKVGSMGRLEHPGCSVWRMPAALYAARVAIQYGPALAAVPIRVLFSTRTSDAKKTQPPPPPPGTVCACGERFGENDRFCPRCGRRRVK